MAIDPIIGGAIITGMLGAGSGIIGSSMSANTAARNTEKQLAWERERALHAHQWEVQDLEAAGINPVLTATGGKGAATSGITPQMPDYSGITSAGTAIMDSVNMIYDNKLKMATAQKAQEEAKTQSFIQETNRTQAIMNAARTGLISKETAVKEIEKLQRQLDLDWAPYEKGAKILNQIATPVLSAFGLKKLGDIKKGFRERPGKNGIDFANGVDYTNWR